MIAQKSEASGDAVAFVLQDGDPTLMPAEMQFPVLFRLEQSSFGVDAWIFDDPKSTKLR